MDIIKSHKNKEWVIINDTGFNHDLDLAIPYFEEFTKTGVLSNDVADLFKIKLRYNENGYKKLLYIDFLNDEEFEKKHNEIYEYE